MEGFHHSFEKVLRQISEILFRFSTEGTSNRILLLKSGREEAYEHVLIFDWIAPTSPFPAPVSYAHEYTSPTSLEGVINFDCLITIWIKTSATPDRAEKLLLCYTDGGCNISCQ